MVKKIGVGVSVMVSVAALVSGLNDFLALSDRAKSAVIWCGGSALVASSLWGAMVFGGWLQRRNGRRERVGSDAPPDMKAAAHRLVRVLHLRWFPGGVSGLDKRFRVSMFVPEPDGVNINNWTCLARTVTKESAGVWPHVDDVERLGGAGLVVNAAINQQNLDVSGLIEGQRHDTDEVGAYLKRSYLTVAGHHERSWPWASLIARIARARNGTILCVMVVEREDGEPIRVPTRHVVAGDTSGASVVHDVCGWELQLAADIWSATWDQR